MPQAGAQETERSSWGGMVRVEGPRVPPCRLLARLADRPGIVLPPYFWPWMETVAVPRLLDPRIGLYGGASASLETEGTEPLLGDSFPVLRVGAGEKPQPSSCWLHSDTWWALDVVTRRCPRPLAGQAPASSLPQGI